MYYVVCSMEYIKLSSLKMGSMNDIGTTSSMLSPSSDIQLRHVTAIYSSPMASVHRMRNPESLQK